MYEKGHDKKMVFSHECLLPERHVKLYIDVDIKVEEAAHFLPYDQVRRKQHFTWDIVDRITLSVITWFGRFFERVFGVPCDVEDWSILCSTDLDKKMSRHFVLSKPECFFRSKLDLMMFMDMVQYQMNREIATRNRSVCFSMLKTDERGNKTAVNEDPLAWMTKMEKQLDPITKVEVKSERSIVDFAVYSDFSFMRGAYCSKMSEPDRILNLVHIDPRNLKDPKNPMKQLDGVRFYVQDAVATFPKSEEAVDKDFALWKRASIQCVEPENGAGLSLPLGLMIPRVKNFTIKKEVIEEMNLETIQGDDSNDGFHSKNVIQSFTNRCWWKTSTVPEGTNRRFVEGLVYSMMNQSTLVSGVGGGSGFVGSFRSWAYSMERVQAGDTDDTCPYKMLRAYFAQVNPPQVERIIDIKPWAECDKILLTKKRDNRTDEEKRVVEQAKESAYLASMPNHKRIQYLRRNNKSRFYSTSLRSSSSHENSSKKKETGSRNDHVVVNLRGTKWCPISNRDHKSCGKVYLKIYRNGDVACRCFSENCQAIASEHGQRSTYRKLYPLNEEQRRILWSEKK
jgi:hypothetical protein